jgi:S1-C subfamily serine protease
MQSGFKNGKLANLVPKKIYFHPTADIALILSPETDYGRLPFTITDDKNKTNAFHIGFPQGKPGAVHSKYLGKMRSRRGSSKSQSEELLVWAEITRVPNFSGSLGGISGGAVIDSTGALIGITSAASIRRGRILTSRPESIRELAMQSNQIILKTAKKRPRIVELSGFKYPIYAKAVIQDRRVARVICKK